MGLPFAIKALLQRTAKRLGYRIEAIREVPAAIDVFDLVVQAEMQRRPEFTFVQIGANDGITDDPIRDYILRYRWRGLLVEPQPAVFERLAKNYAGQPQLRFANVAVAKTAGKLPLYTAGESGDRHFLASFDPAVVRKHLAAHESVARIEIDAVPLAELLRQYEIDRLDLLQIDAEGYDAEVIRMIDFATLRPTIIQFEHVHLPPAEYAACVALLVGQGYRLTQFDINTLAYQQVTGSHQ